MGIAFLLARAVFAVAGIDLALPMLQVQRGKHMGFSRYFIQLAAPLRSSPPFLFAPSMSVILVPRFALHRDAVPGLHCGSGFRAQTDPSLEKLSSQNGFPVFQLFFLM